MIFGIPFSQINKPLNPLFREKNLYFAKLFYFKILVYVTETEERQYPILIKIIIDTRLRRYRPTQEMLRNLLTPLLTDSLKVIMILIPLSKMIKFYTFNKCL